MRCFKHPKEEAVGMCKVCNKGLCAECAVEKDDFVFCQKHAAMEEVVRHVEEEVFAPPARREEAPAAAAPVQARRMRVKPPKPLPPKAQLRVGAKATVTPAIVGGIISGMLMGIPFINFFCIAWMILGGAAAAYFLMLKQSAAENVRGYLRPIDGMIVGGISGVFGANVAVLLNLFAAVNFWDIITSGIVGLGTDPGTANLVFQIIVADPNLDVFSLIARYALMMVAFPVFGAIGGALVSAFTR